MTMQVKGLPFTIAKEGWRWFLIFLVLAFIVNFLSSWAASVCLILGIGAALFFRIPRRQSPRREDAVLSPADGKIVEVAEVEEPDFIKGRCRRVSIFLSILDVHMNYAPVQGIVEWIKYQPGSFHWAFEPKSSDLNENQRIGIRSPKGNILMRQIAGAVARRIVLFKKVAEPVMAGERIGMIKFGSRVEVYLPLNHSIKVKVGERVQGGLTLLSEISR